MRLGKVTMKAGGGTKQNASLEPGAQVSMATQRVATTTRHHHTEKLSGDTYQPLYTHQGQLRGRGKLLHKFMIWSLKLLNLPERVCIIWSLVKTLMLNRGAWSANTADQPWLDFNLPWITFSNVKFCFQTHAVSWCIIHMALLYILQEEWNVKLFWCFNSQLLNQRQRKVKRKREKDQAVKVCEKTIQKEHKTKNSMCTCVCNRESVFKWKKKMAHLRWKNLSNSWIEKKNKGTKQPRDR